MEQCNSVSRSIYLAAFNFPRQQDGSKICSQCKEEQDVQNFYSDKHNRDGLKSNCKKCHKKDRDNRRNNDIIGRLLNSVKQSAKIRGIPFDLKREDILIPIKCPILDIELFINNKWGYNSPSIDRIDSNLGYTKDNIIVCSWRVNQIKGDASLEEIKKIYLNWLPKELGELIVFQNHKKVLDRILIHCRERCKAKNIQYKLTVEDLKIPRYCPILGIEIKRGIKTFIASSPSLDRIDVSQGYVPENIRIISWRANKLKNNATYMEYEKIYFFYKKFEK